MCVGQILKTLVASSQMLKNCFCPVFWFGGIGGETHTFEVTHLWIDVFKADDFLVRLASRLEFEVCKIGRKQMIRMVCPLIAVQLTLLL